MENLGNPWSIYFTKYGPSCKSSWYNIKVFKKDIGHNNCNYLKVSQITENLW